MKRILMMVFRNLIYVPFGWIRLCYYASHVDKYTEEQRYSMLKKIVYRANWGGKITIDAHGVENIPKKMVLFFIPITRGCMMSWLF